MAAIAQTPEPPYYAVIFSNTRTEPDEGYAATAERMLKLAAEQPGFLGVESVRDDQLGITVSYWQDEASIAAWKQQVEHVEARRKGRERWYASFALRVARVERAYDFTSGT